MDAFDIFDIPELVSDARDDVAAALSLPPAPYIAPVPVGFFPFYVRQREALAADLDFLSIVAPELYAWRLRGIAGAPQPVHPDQAAAKRDRRHREHKDGLRVRPLPEVR